MAFHIRDPRTDALVREPAMSRGIGLTEAVQNELAREGDNVPLMQRQKPLFDELDALPRTGLEADKAYYDDLWGEGDDPRTDLA